MANGDSVPLIDVGPIFGPPTRDREGIDHAIIAAAERFGFMTLTGFPQDVPVGLMMRSELLRLFGAPEAIVRKLSRNVSDPSRPLIYRGWFALRDDRASYYEGIEIGPDVAYGSAVVDAANPLRGESPLPPEAALPGWRSAVGVYYLGMERICAAMMGALARGLGVAEDTFSHFFLGGMSSLRLIHYPVRPSSAVAGVPKEQLFVTHEGRARMVINEEHTDFGFMTLLAQDEVEGLQARTPDGAWIDVPPLEGTLVVNFGKLLERWTGGRICATEHRVLSSGRERFSAPFFYEPRLDAKISPLPLANASFFEPFLYGDHVLSVLPKLRRHWQLRGQRQFGVPKPAATGHL